MPQVSIILPNYNYARYLKERVTSILVQTMRDFELIYLDDASTDESNAVIRQFSEDPRLHLNLFDNNSGTVYQRWNDGAAQATGDWLWFAGADDSAHPQFLERLLALARQHPTSAILYSRPAAIDGRGRLCSMYCHWCSGTTQALEGNFFCVGQEAIERLSKGCYLSTASSMPIRRDAFEEVRGFDVNLWVAADWDLYLHLLHRHDIAYTAEPLVYFRQHGTNATSTTKALISDLSSALCLARSYRRMVDDPRYNRDLKQTMLRRVKGRIFDIFTNPPSQITSQISLAAQEIFEIVPDKGLRRYMVRN